jgi:hypothetical protein
MPNFSNSEQIVTILITVLTNSFAGVVSNAAEGNIPQQPNGAMIDFLLLRTPVPRCSEYDLSCQK